jgi:hypothetical protein
MFTGRVLNSFGPKLGWATSFAAIAASFLPFMAVTLRAPEPEVPPVPPRTMREAVWDPFVGFFRQARALEIAAFLFFYKFADNLATALVSPFLGQLGYDPYDIGIAQGTIGIVATIAGTFLGGILTTSIGLGRALWLFGLLQAVSNLGYVAIAEVGVNRPVMYAAAAIEAGTSGMGTGAFGVFLLRLTQRRFSATQYALFSSIFALGRTFAGPPAGALVDAIGWRDFFLLTVPFAIPGLVLLQRFVPLRAKDVPETVEHAEAPPGHGVPITLPRLAGAGAVGALVGTALALAFAVLLLALKAMRGGKAPFDLGAAAVALFHPARAVDWVDVVAAPVAGVVIGFGVAAYLAARARASFSAIIPRPRAVARERRTHMYVRRAALVLALALAALAPGRAPAAPPAPASGTPGRWALLVGLEDGDGDAGLQLRGDLEFPQRPLSPMVGFSIVGSLGYSRFHDEWTDPWWDERWETSANVLKFMGAARFSFGQSWIRPYADAGIGLYYGSWEYEWQELSYPYYGYSDDDSELGVVLRFAAGATFQLSPTFALGGELGFTPYLGDDADDTTTSLLLSATFRL